MIISLSLYIYIYIYCIIYIYIYIMAPDPWQAPGPRGWGLGNMLFVVSYDFVLCLYRLLQSVLYVAVLFMLLHDSLYARGICLMFSD